MRRIMTVSCHRVYGPENPLNLMLPGFLWRWQVDMFMRQRNGPAFAIGQQSAAGSLARNEKQLLRQRAAAPAAGLQ